MCVCFGHLFRISRICAHNFLSFFCHFCLCSRKQSRDSALTSQFKFPRDESGSQLQDSVIPFHYQEPDPDPFPPPYYISVRNKIFIKWIQRFAQSHQSYIGMYFELKCGPTSSSILSLSQREP